MSKTYKPTNVLVLRLKLQLKQNLHGVRNVNIPLKLVVTEIQDQGSCEAGWAFASAGSVEGVKAIVYN